MATIEGEETENYELMVDPSMSNKDGPRRTSNSASDNKGWCAANAKQLIILVVILAFIIALVVDLAIKSCVQYEAPDTRIHRLECSELAPIFRNSSKFLCATKDDPEWQTMTHNGEPRCGHHSGCTLVEIQAFLDWIAKNPTLGFLVFMLAYIFACIFFIPGSVLTIGAGVSFGAALGLGEGAPVAILAVWLGALLGASCAFFLGRFIFRSWVEGLTQKFKILNAVDQAVRIKGLLTVTLLRFSPVIPFSVFNYLMGATAVSFKNYFIGSAIGMLPGTAAYVFIGALIGSATKGGNSKDCAGGSNTIQIIIGVVGGVFTIVAIVVITIVAKKQLSLILDETNETEKNSEGHSSINSSREAPESR